MPATPSNTTQWMRATRIAGPALYLITFGASVVGALAGGQGAMPPGAWATATLLTIGLACLTQFDTKPQLQKLSPPTLDDNTQHKRLSRVGLWFLLGCAGASIIYSASIALAYGRTEQPFGYLAFACIATYWVLTRVALAKIKLEVTRVRQAKSDE